MAPLVALFGCAAFPAGDPARPDIVLISIDSLRADHLRSYGYERETSPFLDKLASEGLRFADARSASPWTLPSHLTMLTGLPSIRHAVVDDDLALAPGVPQVQEALSAAGWATAGFVSTIYVSGTYGFSRGFDRYEDHGITERDNLQHPVRAETIVDEALAWGRDNGDGKPVFLFLHFYDVHYPYRPPAPYDTLFDRAGTLREMRYRTYTWHLNNPMSGARMKHLIAQYDESIAYVDAQLARLHAGWKRPVRFIVTSDHGEELGERGSWGHAHTLYREALDIPLIIAGAGVATGVRTERVGTLDIAPTIAAMAGVVKAGLPWAGVDVRGPVPERVFVAETSRFDSARLSLQDGGMRLDVDLAHGAVGLYADRDERKNLADARPDVVDAMRRRLYAMLGEPFATDGAALSTPGFLFRGGERAEISTPGPFGMYPPDAPLAGFRGVVDTPAQGPLRYAGPRTVTGIVVSDETRAQLEQLGYTDPE